ncbi:MAG: acetyl-CoA carboxylase carboxyltransferase subunit alpha [Erysipelotrichales bacterium]
MDKRIKNIEKELKYFESNNLDTSSLEHGLRILKKEYNSSLSAWDKVKLARQVDRPSSLSFINNIFDNFIELHGDRCYGDDKAIIGGIGMLENTPVTIIGVQKGKEANENIIRNFGMPHPEGYRKAMRLMEQAEKFNRPIVTFVNTPGAYPGFGAEKRGQAHAIANNLVGMMNLKVPVISIFIGEGGSGGALALAVANQVWMLENSIYSILSPEGFASIIHKDASMASEVVDSMKITADSLYDLGLVDCIISESEHGINDGFNQVCENLKDKLVYEINEMQKRKGNALQRERYHKFRKIK